MICKKTIKHVFFILGVIFAFSTAGQLGMIAEILYRDLAVSTTIFGVSLTGIMTGLVKVYHIFIS